MNNFVIIPDSSSDLTADLRERFDIPDYLRGVMYFPDNHSEPADLDWGNISADDYYNSMKAKNIMYKTASVPIGNITEIFEKYLSQGIDVLSVSLSSALSGNYQSCMLVAKELMEKYPGRKVICVDSLRYSTSLALLIIMASELKKNGATIEEVADWMNDNKCRIHQMGPMDDMFFLVKTGRLSNFTAFFATVMGVNPMGEFNNNGLTEVLAKFKGKRSAFDATIKYIGKTIIEPEKQIIFVAHSNRAEAANTLAEMIKKEFAPRELIINTVGMSCGASIGPGLCAAFYHGKPISQDLVEEKAIMADIVNASK